MRFQRAVLQGVCGKVLFSSLQAGARKLPVSESVEQERPLLVVCEVPSPLPPGLLYVKCLIIKKIQILYRHRGFSYLQKWLLCVDVLGELDFCVLALIALSR